jgi:hypothetical protein
VTELDDELVPEVVAVLDEVGVAITITETGTTLTPSTGAVSGGATVHSDVIASPPAPYRSYLIDGDLIRTGDVQLVVKGSVALGFTPKTGWKVAVAGTELKIVSVDELRSGASIAAFVLQCRR